DLIGSIPAAEALVTVDVEHRDEDEGEPPQRAWRCTAREQLAQREKARVLAIDLTGVNAALHEHHRTALLARRRRIQHAILRGHQCQHGARFGRAAELHAAYFSGPGLLEAAAQALNFLVAAGALEAAALGERAQLGGAVRRRDAQHAQEPRQRVAQN